MAGNLTFASIQELVTLLGSADVQASVDPSDLNLPAAWVALDELAPIVTLDGQIRLTVSVYLIAPDVDPRRAMDQLAPLYNALLEVVTPDGPVRPWGVILPDNPTAMPALRVPVNLYE